MLDHISPLEHMLNLAEFGIGYGHVLIDTAAATNTAAPTTRTATRRAARDRIGRRAIIRTRAREAATPTGAHLPRQIHAAYDAHRVLSRLMIVDVDVVVVAVEMIVI